MKGIYFTKPPCNFNLEKKLTRKKKKNEKTGSNPSVEQYNDQRFVGAVKEVQYTHQVHLMFLKKFNHYSTKCWENLDQFQR